LPVGLGHSPCGGDRRNQARPYREWTRSGVPQAQAAELLHLAAARADDAAVLGVARSWPQQHPHPVPLGFLGSLLLNIGFAMLAFNAWTVADVTCEGNTPAAQSSTGVHDAASRTFGGFSVFFPEAYAEECNSTYGTFRRRHRAPVGHLPRCQAHHLRRRDQRGEEKTPSGREARGRDRSRADQQVFTQAPRSRNAGPD